MAFTPPEQESVRRAEAELARAVSWSRAWLKEQTGGLTGELLLNGAELAAVKNTREELARAEEWRTTWREWAEKAWHPNGYVYKLSHYLQVGKDIASALSFHTKQGFNASSFNLIGEAVEKKAAAVEKAAADLVQAAEDTAKKLNGPWSLATKLKLAGGGLVALALAVLVGTRRRP